MFTQSSPSLEFDDVLVVSPGLQSRNDFVDVFLVYSWFHFRFFRNLPERVLVKILFPPSMPSQVRRVLPSGHHNCSTAMTLET